MRKYSDADKKVDAFYDPSNAPQFPSLLTEREENCEFARRWKTIECGRSPILSGPARPAVSLIPVALDAHIGGVPFNGSSEFAERALPKALSPSKARRSQSWKEASQWLELIRIE